MKKTNYFSVRDGLKFVSNAVANKDKKHVAVDNGLISFDHIPGPKSYPLIGTLYKYLPFIGKLQYINTKVIIC